MNRSRMALCWLPCAAVLAAAGCGPSRVLDPPPDWPVRWQNLELYNTPRAFILASQPQAAREAEDIVNRTWKDFERRTGGVPSKGLVVIANITEEQPIRDPKVFYLEELGDHGEAPVQEAEMTRRWELIEEAARSQGVSLATELQMRTITLDKPELRTILGMPDAVVNDVEWAVLLPTRRLIDQASHQAMKEKIVARGTGPLVFVATSPLLVAEELRMANRASVNRDVEIFGRWVSEQNGWTPDEKEDHQQAYTQRKLDEAMFPVLSLMRDTVEETVITVAGTTGAVVGTVVQPLLPKPPQEAPPPAKAE